MFLVNRRHVLGAVSSAALAAALGRVVNAAGSERIQAGQIGTMHAHASGKMATMRKFDDLFDVVGVVEPDEQRWSAVKDTAAYRGVRRMSEEQLLASPGLQVVAVETEVRGLVPTAARCVAAGKHVHLDKPAGESLPMFKKLLDDATRRELTVQMGYMFRYNPAFLFLFQAIRDGWLGEIFEIHGVISKTVDVNQRRLLAAYRGGSMFELGCHLIDALVAAMGKPDKVTPYARRTRPEQDDLSDNMLAVFEYPRATATIRSALVEVDGGRRRQFVACGTQGTIEIQPLEPPRLVLTLDRARGPFKRGTQEVALAKLDGRYDGDFLDLARIVRGEKPTDYPPVHDLAVQEAVLRASGLPVE